MYIEVCAGSKQIFSHKEVIYVEQIKLQTKKKTLLHFYLLKHFYVILHLKGYFDIFGLKNQCLIIQFYKHGSIHNSLMKLIKLKDIGIELIFTPMIVVKYKHSYLISVMIYLLKFVYINRFCNPKKFDMKCYSCVSLTWSHDKYHIIHSRKKNNFYLNTAANLSSHTVGSSDAPCLGESVPSVSNCKILI